MTEGICPIGNTGFPVIIKGLVNSKTQIQPNDIELQFGPEVQLTWDKPTGILSSPGSHSFFLGGSQYTLNTLRICKHTISGLEDGSEPRIGELQVWGFPPSNRVTKNDLAVLVIPIFQSTSGFSQTGRNLRDVLVSNASIKIEDLIPLNQDVIRYSTCIEMVNKKHKTISVAVWRRGIQWDGKNSDFPKGTDLGPAGIPLFLTENTPTANSFKDDLKTGDKILGKELVQNEISIPYSTSIQADTVDYDTRFRQMYYAKKVQKLKEQGQNLKCVAIDRDRDIKNGRLSIDPNTGESLENTLEEEDAQKAELLQDENVAPQVEPSTIEKWISTILGTIFGLFLLAITVVFMKKYLSSKNAADMAKNLQTAAEVASAPAIQWMDLVLPLFLGIVGICVLTVSVVGMLVYPGKK
jgi:hypothetical protein